MGFEVCRRRSLPAPGNRRTVHPATASMGSVHVSAGVWGGYAPSDLPTLTSEVTTVKKVLLLLVVLGVLAAVGMKTGVIKTS